MDYAEPAASPPATPEHLLNPAPAAPPAAPATPPAAPATPPAEPAAAAPPAEPDWRTGLPAEVQGWDEAKNAASQDAFWQQMTSHRSMLGQSIRVPGEDAGEADWAAYRQKLARLDPGLIPTPKPDDADSTAALYTALGKPEAPEGYAVVAPDGIEYDVAAIDTMRAAAHKLNLTNAQFDGFVRAQAEMNLANAAKNQEVVDAAAHALKSEWGVAYDEKVATAQATFAKFFPDVDPALMGPQQLKGFAGIAAAVGVEGTNLGSQHGRGGGGAMTPEEANLQLAEIRNNPQHPYNGYIESPEKAAAIKRVIKLQAAAAGLPPPDDLNDRL